MARENERRSAFKQTIGEGDGRRRREETTKQIRKNKREEQIMKRRQMPAPATMADNTPSTSSDTNTTSKRASISDIPEFTRILMNPNSTISERTEATRGFRRLLSVDRDPPVDAVLQSGVLPYLVANLTANPHENTLIFESAWALTNIASTSKTHVVVEAQAVGPLIQLMQHEKPDVRDQAAWCLGNIAGDNTEYRDLVLHQGIVEPLLLNMVQPANMTLLNNITWAVSNLCRGKPAPDMHLLAPLVGPLTDLLNKPVTPEVLVDAVWALSYLSDGPNEKIEIVMQTGVAAKLVELLSDKSSTILTPTIRCLGNFVTGSDMQTQAVVDSGILQHLGDLLDHPRKSIRKETCWLASNIAAGTHSQITSLMKDNNLMRKLIEAATNAVWETKKEALWTLSNICTIGNDEHVRCLVQLEGLRPLAEALDSKNADATILNACLDAVERVLEVGDRHNEEYAKMFDEYNGIDYLEGLQEHPSNSVYEKVIKMIENFFGADENEDENLAPTTTATGTFEFGLSSPKQLFPTNNNMTAAPVFQFGDANRAF